MHPNSLPLLGISTPKNFSLIIQFSPNHINLNVLIRKGGVGDTIPTTGTYHPAALISYFTATGKCSVAIACVVTEFCVTGFH